MHADSPTLSLARALIERRSVTPIDAGCQQLLGDRLSACGFHVEHVKFGEVDNLWARRGEGAPLFTFLGHTDVVPPGTESAWRIPPFQPEIRDGLLYGRGAADMKGSIAAMVVALERFLVRVPSPGLALSVLLTSDEEGPSVDGVRRMIPLLAARGETIDCCLVGEPSSTTRIADIVKNGRRGSLNGHLVVTGRQGHVAYPHLADNPIHSVLEMLAPLVCRRWDDGSEHFPPTSFQVSNIRAGTGADNVIPGQAEALFNFRYSTAHTEASLREAVEKICTESGHDYRIEWRHSGGPFLTEKGRLLEAIRAASMRCLGYAPEPSTAGGTSDGRFVAPTGAEVVELGPVNATIHQVDEHVAVEDLERLTDLYEAILDELSATAR